MTCKACGDELAGRRTCGAFHRSCVERLLAAQALRRRRPLR